MSLSAHLMQNPVTSTVSRLAFTPGRDRIRSGREMGTFFFSLARRVFMVAASSFFGIFPSIGASYR
jgi:hypothetical protein